jgi:hypothetical protein
MVTPIVVVTGASAALDRAELRECGPGPVVVAMQVYGRLPRVVAERHRTITWSLHTAKDTQERNSFVYCDPRTSRIAPLIGWSHASRNVPDQSLVSI